MYLRNKDAQFHANKTVWESEIKLKIKLKLLKVNYPPWLPNMAGSIHAQFEKAVQEQFKTVTGCKKYNTTSNELVLAESGLSDLKSMVH